MGTSCIAGGALALENLPKTPRTVAVRRLATVVCVGNTGAPVQGRQLYRIGTGSTACMAGLSCAAYACHASVACVLPVLDNVPC